MSTDAINELRNGIAALLNKFEAETEWCVTDLHLNRTDVTTYRSTYVTEMRDVIVSLETKNSPGRLPWGSKK